MANTLTDVIPKLLAQGLLALRQQAIMPRLVNRDYDVLAAQKGATINVPIPSAIVVADVAPAATPPATADVAPTTVAIALDQWKEAPFYMTDKDMLEAMNGTIPMQASEAIKALANTVDSFILGLYKRIYGFVGTPATTPFASDLSAYTQARAKLNTQLAPVDDRRVILDPDAEGNCLLLRAFQDAGFGGGTGVIQQGQIGRKVGADWWMDQNTPTHTAGGGSGYLINNVGGYAVGIKTVTVDTGSGTLLLGDIITFAGDTQTYVVISTVGGGTVTSITFEPGLKLAVADNAAITKKASHVVNLLIHRDCFAFASRPLVDQTQGLGNLISSAVDPISGLALRLEVSREHKRTRYAFDVLYGGAMVRSELGARIAG